MHYRFEWDPAKAAENLRKHHVSFEEAKTVYLDVFANESYDVNPGRRRSLYDHRDVRTWTEIRNS
jgi:uncharacterized DUF497 family protein